MKKRYFISCILVVMLASLLVACNSSEDILGNNMHDKNSERESTTNKVEVSEGEVIPSGCSYTIKATNQILYEGEKFPENPATGDIYRTEDYYYCYGVIAYEFIHNGKDEPCEGWSLKAIDDKATYEEIVSSIAGQPVTNMNHAFYGRTKLKEAPNIPIGVKDLDFAFSSCENLEEAPDIPSGVENMNETFYGCVSLKGALVIPSSVRQLIGAFCGCESLKNAPVIPNGVEYMSGTFSGCTSLTGEIVINAKAKRYDYCFAGIDFTKQNITLTGDCDVLDELRATGIN